MKWFFPEQFILHAEFHLTAIKQCNKRELTAAVLYLFMSMQILKPKISKYDYWNAQ